LIDFFNSHLANTIADYALFLLPQNTFSLSTVFDRGERRRPVKIENRRGLGGIRIAPVYLINHSLLPGSDTPRSTVNDDAAKDTPHSTLYTLKYPPPGFGTLPYSTPVTMSFDPISRLHKNNVVRYPPLTKRVIVIKWCDGCF